MSRSIAEQSEAELGGPLSILVRQRRDHARLDELIQQARRTTGEAQEAVLTAVCRLVFSHAFAEEVVVWPLARRLLPDGEELTLRIEREHQEVNELVAALERSDPGDPGRAAMLERVFAVLDDDVRDEEDLLLPRLQERLDRSALRRTGVAWEVLRRTSPTHAHPVVARRPPGNVLAALPLSVLDRSRDRLDQLARRGPAALRQPARRTSEALRRASRTVEGLPPYRTGERPPTHREPGQTS